MMRALRRARPVLTVALVFSLCVCSNAHAQGRTDVITLANGDRLTGEVVRLERGRLEFKTDDAGTLYLEWDKLTSVVAIARLVEVLTADGRRFLGRLGPAAVRQVALVTVGGTVTLPMHDVTLITPIGTSLWRKLDGSFDLGFSFTKSSGIAQLNLNSDTVHRGPATSLRLTASFTQTTQDSNEDGQDERDDRGSIEASWLRYPWQRWFITAAGRFETNESLGLKLRSQIGGALGPRLINSNRAQMTLGLGMVVNNEQGVDVPSTENVEGLFVFRTSYFTYDRPKTNLDVSFAYYPSFSDPGRHRLQLDSAIRRELLKDFFVSLNLFDTFDSRPPNPTADRNDVGVVMSIGWSY